MSLKPAHALCVALSLTWPSLLPSLAGGVTPPAPVVAQTRVAVQTPISQTSPISETVTVVLKRDGTVSTPLQPALPPGLRLEPMTLTLNLPPPPATAAPLTP